MYKWDIKGITKSKDKDKRLEEIKGLLLKNRGIDKKDQNQFFNPSHPLDLPLSKLKIDTKQINKAVDRIIKSIKDKDAIVVYGDYDADGICATAIVWETLYSLSKNAMPYLPDRVEEGYGLSIKGIDNVIKKYNPKLLITVDNGVTAVEAIAYAKSKGIDTIICDHHVIPSKKPNPYSLVHTTLLSGSGIAWILVRELAKKLDNKNWKTEIAEKLGLSAIGTVADLLSLNGVNRSIVKYGINELRITKRPGLLSLYNESRLNLMDIDTYHIGYIIAPRINATGRISHGMNSLRLLCTTSRFKAMEYAKELEYINGERKRITLETVDHADIFYQKDGNLEDKIIIVSHSSYNQGVIGLVAGKLVEKYYKPAIVLSVGKDISKASARSIAGFDVVVALRGLSKLLIDCGGHPMAAGFTIKTENIEIFKKTLIAEVKKSLSDNLLKKTIVAECEINTGDIDNKLYSLVSKFKPFGQSNREPLFVIYNLKPVSVRLLGKEGSHLKFDLEDRQGNKVSAIGFGMGQMYGDIKRDSLIDCVCFLTENSWNGKKTIEVKLKDLKIH